MKKSKGHWVHERSSGYMGYRCIRCATWIYENENEEKICSCDKNGATNVAKPALPTLNGKKLNELALRSPDDREVRVVKYEDGVGICISSKDLNGELHTLKFGLRQDAAKVLRGLLNQLDV